MARAERIEVSDRIRDFLAKAESFVVRLHQQSGNLRGKPAEEYELLSGETSMLRCALGTIDHSVLRRRLPGVSTLALLLDEVLARCNTQIRRLRGERRRACLTAKGPSMVRLGLSSGGVGRTGSMAAVSGAG